MDCPLICRVIVIGARLCSVKQKKARECDLGTAPSRFRLTAQNPHISAMGYCTAMQSCHYTAGTVRRCTSCCCSVAIDPCDQTPLPQSAGSMPILCARAHKTQQAIPHFCSRASCKERAALSFLATLVRSLGSIPARWHDWEPGSWPEDPLVHTYWASATARLLHLERQTSPTSLTT